VVSVCIVHGAASPAFPLKVSEDRRHLVDQRGTPFLHLADTPWMIFQKLTEAEAKEYMVRRREQGFTSQQVQLTGFLGMTNLAGELPFAGTSPEQYFAQPNEKSFTHVDRIVEEARRQGMLLAIAPAWSGCCGEGWAGKEKDGANSLKHRRAVLESRPWWKLMPDVNNVVAVEGRGALATNDYAVTALADDGSFALSYLPTKRSLTLDLTKLSGEHVVASWFNPRTGEASRIGEFTDKKRHAFEPPGDGDWVLVLDDSVKTFPPLGTSSFNK